jgi:cytochrome c-type protein NapB
VATAVVLGLALFGFLEGTRPVSTAPSFLPSEAAAATGTAALPGLTYRELRARRFGPNHRTSSDLEPLRDRLPDPQDPFVPRPEERPLAVGARAERRAFDGAPPVIPHAIDEQGTAACLACHETGLVVQNRVAPAMSHEPHSSCTQCHVPAIERGRPPAVDGDNGFVGRASSGAGSRAWYGAPPTMPHGSWMRERCASCHGVSGLPGLRTSHPERGSCPQCHVLEAGGGPPLQD